MIRVTRTIIGTAQYTIIIFRYHTCINQTARKGFKSLKKFIILIPLLKYKINSSLISLLFYTEAHIMIHLCAKQENVFVKKIFLLGIVCFTMYSCNEIGSMLINVRFFASKRENEA